MLLLTISYSCGGGNGRNNRKNGRNKNKTKNKKKKNSIKNQNKGENVSKSGTFKSMLNVPIKVIRNNFNSESNIRRNTKHKNKLNTSNGTKKSNANSNNNTTINYKLDKINYLEAKIDRILSVNKNSKQKNSDICSNLFQAFINIVTVTKTLFKKHNLPIPHSLENFILDSSIFLRNFNRCELKNTISQVIIVNYKKKIMQFYNDYKQIKYAFSEYENNNESLENLLKKIDIYYGIFEANKIVTNGYAILEKLGVDDSQLSLIQKIEFGRYRKTYSAFLARLVQLDTYVYNNFTDYQDFKLELYSSLSENLIKIHMRRIHNKFAEMVGLKNMYDIVIQDGKTVNGLLNLCNEVENLFEIIKSCPEYNKKSKLLCLKDKIDKLEIRYKEKSNKILEIQMLQSNTIISLKRDSTDRNFYDFDKNKTVTETSEIIMRFKDYYIIHIL